MGGKYKYSLLVTFLTLALTMVFAQPELLVFMAPEEPNITLFSAGVEKIYVGSVNWQGYNQITLNTHDFEVIGGNNTLSINSDFVRFDINGQTAGLKEYSLTFSGSSPDFTINESFFVEAEPLIEGGPYVLSDFDFDEIYNSDQDIEFDCFGSTVYSTACKSAGYYRVGLGEWDEFNFSNPISFSFDSAETIEIQAQNNLGISTLTSFNLIIDKSNPRMLNLNPSVSGSNVTLTYSAEDASSGIKNYWVSKDNTNWVYTENTSYQFTGLSGTNNFYVKATDNTDKNSDVMEVSATIQTQTSSGSSGSLGSSGGSSGAYVIINNTESTQDDNSLEETVVDDNSTEELSQTENNETEDQNTDFKEDTYNNNLVADSSESGDSAKTTVSVAPTGSTINFLDLTGLFVLSVPEVDLSVPEVDTTGMVTLLLPKASMVWFPMMLLFGIAVLVVLIIRKRGADR